MDFIGRLCDIRVICMARAKFWIKGDPARNKSKRASDRGYLGTGLRNRLCRMDARGLHRPSVRGLACRRQPRLGTGEKFSCDRDVLWRP